ncbi:MAG: TIGR04283 family arsenosugar biosynthesis glycosyltransferase [Verrucomicrobiota bacterium]|nr:TIGR04283 family arsenosugar biosynthesis glycosyltransferase [Verrucomicrobiota bacterium]
MNSSPPFVSIIVPVLNEADLIEASLRHLRSLGPDLEIIVVDGGSSDGTWSVAEPLADRVITAQRGRASQMNAGAAVARGGVLWFMHVDLKAPSHSIAKIQKALTDPQMVGGCFGLRFPRPELIYRVSDSLGNLGVNVFGFSLGDHGIFCRRSVFRQVGGYREFPILEDAEIYRSLRAEGRMVQLRQEVVSDPRTFEAQGRYRTTAVYFLILALYVLGLPIRILNRIYRRFRGQGSPISERPG